MCLPPPHIDIVTIAVTPPIHHHHQTKLAHGQKGGSECAHDTVTKWKEWKEPVHCSPAQSIQQHQPRRPPQKANPSILFLHRLLDHPVPSRPIPVIVISPLSLPSFQLLLILISIFIGLNLSLYHYCLFLFSIPIWLLLTKGKPKAGYQQQEASTLKQQGQGQRLSWLYSFKTTTTGQGKTVQWRDLTIIKQLPSPF